MITGLCVITAREQWVGQDHLRLGLRLVRFRSWLTFLSNTNFRHMKEPSQSHFVFVDVSVGVDDGPTRDGSPCGLENSISSRNLGAETMIMESSERRFV